MKKEIRSSAESVVRFCTTAHELCPFGSICPIEVHYIVAIQVNQSIYDVPIGD